MRETFWEHFAGIMEKDEKVILLSSDTGFKVLDEIRKKYSPSGRCINVGIAEQNMIGVASGLAKLGFKPYVYAIAPFIAYRAIEQVRDDIAVNNYPVKMIGIGAGFDYWPLGSTHHADSDIAFMRAIPNIEIYQPCDKFSTRMLAEMTYQANKPVYFRLTRYGEDRLYPSQISYDGFNVVFPFTHSEHDTIQVTILSSGVILEEALNLAHALSDAGYSVLLVDLYRIKPIDEVALFAQLRGHIIVIEEHNIYGGIGEMAASLLMRKSFLNKQKENPATGMTHFGIDDAFIRVYGDRECLLNYTGLASKAMYNLWDANLQCSGIFK